MEASRQEVQQRDSGKADLTRRIAIRDEEIPYLECDRDRWEARARETETTLSATRADFQEARDAIATLQEELLKSQAALVRAEELEQQPPDRSEALVSESQPQTFKPSWVRVSQKEAAEIVTNESSKLDPLPVTVAKLNRMSMKMLEQYNLRRVNVGRKTIYEFYQRTVPIDIEK